MPKQTLKVEVEPEIFKWLLETSGHTTEEISKRLSVTKDTVERWLKKEDMPTLNQIKELSKYFKRSLAVFLLSKPPEEPPLPKDRRSIKEAKPLSPKTYKAIRTARWIQSIAENLMTNLNLDVKPTVEKFSYSDDPQIVAQHIRNNLGLNIENQFKWKDKEAFNKWRESIENKNLIVLQFPIPIDEVRGFALTDKEPFVIVVSSSDDPNAKIFTLFHEYAHIILKEASICNPLVEIEKEGRDNYEKWCNSFAGSFLLPDENIRSDFRILDKIELSEKISKISKKYKVSKHAVLVRLRNLKLIDEIRYKQEINKLMTKKGRIGGRSLPLPEKRLQERGKKFVSLVIQNIRDNHITSSDALDYLAIKTKHFDKIRTLEKLDILGQQQQVKSKSKNFKY